MNVGLLIILVLLVLSFMGIPIYIALGIGTLMALNIAEMPLIVLPQKMIQVIAHMIVVRQKFGRKSLLEFLEGIHSLYHCFKHHCHSVCHIKCVIMHTCSPLLYPAAESRQKAPARDLTRKALFLPSPEVSCLILQQSSHLNN